MTFENVQDADSLKIYLAQGDTEKKPKTIPIISERGSEFFSFRNTFERKQKRNFTALCSNDREWCVVCKGIGVNVFNANKS